MRPPLSRGRKIKTVTIISKYNSAAHWGMTSAKKKERRAGIGVRRVAILNRVVQGGSSEEGKHWSKISPANHW